MTPAAATGVFYSVMPELSVKEWELLSLFEVEPQLREPGEPWALNDAAYLVVQGDLSLSFAIAPAYRDVRIVLEYKGARVYELNATGVMDVRYIQQDKVEELEVALTERSGIGLRIKPHIAMKLYLWLPE